MPPLNLYDWYEANCPGTQLTHDVRKTTWNEYWHQAERQ